MTPGAFGVLGVSVLGFLATGYAVEQATGRPHGSMAVAALGVGVAAAGAATLVERLLVRRGAEAFVAGYWIGVGVRGLVALAGATLLAEFAFDPQDRHAWLLWLLAVYLTALAFETVRSVRAADLARLAKTARGGGTE